MPTDFDLLQAAVRAAAERRDSELRACEAFLNALYHAFRHANGPGLPLNNVSLDWADDQANRIRPVPLGGWHAAWFRLGVCEVYIRVRRHAGRFVGEYGPSASFSREGVDEEALLVLARQILRELIAEQEGKAGDRGDVN
ncbi:hypothetical protein [Deinococcus sp.]|uniref:hypothetical protein n=1 Tax=Deinococcus sp. TaxID=47478 RepID=UPI003C7D48B9